MIYILVYILIGLLAYFVFSYNEYKRDPEDFKLYFKRNALKKTFKRMAFFMLVFSFLWPWAIPLYIYEMFN